LHQLATGLGWQLGSGFFDFLQRFHAVKMHSCEITGIGVGQLKKFILTNQLGIQVMRPLRKAI
jgi:hypothetical protein